MKKMSFQDNKNQKDPGPGKANFLSIVFSFRNEEDVLEELIGRVRKVVQDLQQAGKLSGYELIFVNDASVDNSLKILLEQAKSYNDIRIINMSRCFGVSPCVMAGFAHAQGDWVVYMDADLQDPPELIPELLDVHCQSKADIVHTVRLSRKGESIGKLFFTKIGYFVLNKTSTINLPIEAGDFKFLSRRVVMNLLNLKEYNPFTRGLVCWVGFKQEFVTYHRQERKKGKTKFRVLSPSVINNFLNSALISFSAVPLRIALLLGVVVILFDLALFVHVIFEKLQGKAIPGWTAIMVAVLFMGGVQFLCMGFLGLYLYHIHEQVRNRPNYIIESTYGFPSNVNGRQERLNASVYS